MLRSFGDYPKTFGSCCKTLNMESHVHLLHLPAKAPFSFLANSNTHSWGLGGADSILQATGDRWISQVNPKRGPRDWTMSD